MKRILNLLLVAVLLASLVVPLLPQQSALADDWSAWSQSKILVIQGGNVSTANYTAVPITLHYGSGTDNSTDIFLNYQSKKDFGDVRFANASDVAIPYYEENYPQLEHGGVANPIYSKINDPSAIEYHGKTYIVWQSGLSTLNPYIAVRDLTGNWSQPVQISNTGLTGDDHGAPSIFIDLLGYIHVTWGAHNSPLHYAISTNTEDISSWTIRPDILADASYPRWIQTSNGTIVMVYRTDSAHKLSYITTSNRGQTWYAPVNLLDCAGTDIPYWGNVAYDSANETLHIAGTYSFFATGLMQSLYEGYFKLSTGHMYSTNGTDLGTSVSIATANASLRVFTSAGVFEVYIPSVALDNNGYPYILDTVQDGTGYHQEIMSWNGASWSGLTNLADTAYKYNGQALRVETSSNITAYVITGGVTSTNPTYNRGGDLTKITYNGAVWTSLSLLTAANSSIALNAPAIVYGSNTSVVCAQGATEQYIYSDLQIFYFPDGLSTKETVIQKTARIWVNPGSISQYPTKTAIKLYYGNPAASSISNAANTFSKYNDGATGTFSSYVAGSANLTDFPIPRTFLSIEPNETDSFAYGDNFSSNVSVEFLDVKNMTGANNRALFYMFIDSNTVTGMTSSTADGIAAGRRRAGVYRYNCETTKPSSISVWYQDAAGNYFSWNGTSGWTAGIGGKEWSIIGSVNIRLSMDGTTIRMDVNQVSGESAIGGTASIALTSVKAFSTGKTVIWSDLFTNVGNSNGGMTGMFMRPYMNQEPAWLGSAVSPLLTTVSSAVLMDKDGIVTANVTGNFTDVGTTPTFGWFAYKNTANTTWATTANTSYSSNGTVVVNLPTNLTVGETYSYYFAATSMNGTSVGAINTFTLTMPTVTTGTYNKFLGNSATLNGNVTNMGVASDTYVSFEWGYTAAYGTTTTESTQAAIGSFTKNITYDPLRTVHYRSVSRVGAVYSYGSDQEIPIDNNVDTSVMFIVPLGLLLIVVFAAQSEVISDISPIGVIILILVVGATIGMVSSVFVNLF